MVVVVVLVVIVVGYVIVVIVYGYNWWLIVDGVVKYVVFVFVLIIECCDYWFGEWFNILFEVCEWIGGIGVVCCF